MEKVQAGTYYKVPLHDVIFEAKQYLQILDSTTDDDFLEILAWRSVREINAISSLKTEVLELEVCNGEVKLPTNMFRFLWFRICQPLTSDGDNFPNTQPQSAFLNYIYADIPFLNEECGCEIQEGGGSNPAYNYQSVVRINNGKLIFSNKRFIFFNKIRLAGIFYNTDSSGVFVVNDNMVSAVVYRICYKYILANIKKYDRMQLNEYKGLMIAQANKVRSNDFKRNFQDNIDQVQAMYQAYNYAPLISRNRSKY
jgi:hypothetical protein